VVGNKGSIAYYNYRWWDKLESGTTLDIHDIWGEVDPLTNETTILAVASLQNYGRAIDLLQINGNTVKKIDTTGIHVNQRGVWFKTGKSFYVVGNGVYKKKRLGDKRWELESGHPLVYKESMRGNDWNDLFVVGDFGLVSHFNGITWEHYNIGLPMANLYSVSVKGNVVTAVGQDGSKAVVIVGRRK
jgi:hypothetical protein